MKTEEREYRVAIVAQGALKDALDRDPSTLKNEGLERMDFVNFQGRLDSTYLIRIFAEFETGLRDYWKHRSKRKTVPKVSDMLKSIGSSRDIGYQELDNVDNVRKYRNRLVHEEDSEARVVDLGEARKILCIFFSKLPEDW